MAVGCDFWSQEGQQRPEGGWGGTKFPLEGCWAFFWSERKSEVKEGMWGSVEGALSLGEVGDQRRGRLWDRERETGQRWVRGQKPLGP